MPFIETKTNVAVSKEAETKIKEALGQAISIIPGKSENWLMLAIEGNVPMYFRGDDSAPVAFVDVKTFGSAPGSTSLKICFQSGVSITLETSSLVPTPVRNTTGIWAVSCSCLSICKT